MSVLQALAAEDPRQTGRYRVLARLGAAPWGGSSRCAHDGEYTGTGPHLYRFESGD